jgi:hypothetical protein
MILQNKDENCPGEVLLDSVKISIVCYKYNRLHHNSLSVIALAFVSLTSVLSLFDSTALSVSTADDSPAFVALAVTSPFVPTPSR